MILLEQLYRLLHADEQTRVLEPFFHTEQVSLANGAVQVDFVVPNERHAILSTYFAQWIDPGAGQNIVTRQLAVFGTTSGTLHSLSRGLASAADAVVFDRVVGEFILLPGMTVRAVATFNSGAIDNVVALTIIGMRIPLGNIERV